MFARRGRATRPRDVQEERGEHREHEHRRAQQADDRVVGVVRRNDNAVFAQIAHEAARSAEPANTAVKTESCHALATRARPSAAPATIGTTSHRSLSSNVPATSSKAGQARSRWPKLAR